MQNSLEVKLRNSPRPYLTDVELGLILNGTADSRYGKVKRLLAQGKLLHIRRGLYCLTEKLGYLTKPHSFELAQFIYWPSYISLESALSFHKLIPEAVYTTTSVTGRRSKEFKTPLGLFNYLHLPNKELFIGVEIVKENGHQFFIAKPWKAICDYVYCYKKNWESIEPLLESLRIDFESLPTLSDEEVFLLKEYYQHTRINHFLKGVQRDLGNRVFTSD